MKLTKEDIKKYGTIEEQQFLEDRYSEFDPTKKNKLKVTKLHFPKKKKIKTNECPVSKK
jgi:hypothetical protein